MTDLITEARELCEAATPGPWEWTVSDILGTELDAENLKGVIRLADDYPGYPECGEHLIMQLSESDAAFIARSRTLIPELCDALEKAETELDRLTEALGKIENLCLKGPCYGISAGKLAVEIARVIDEVRVLPAAPEEGE